MNQNRIKNNAKTRINRLDKSKIEIDIDTLQVFYNYSEGESLEITDLLESFTKKTKSKNAERLARQGSNSKKEQLKK